MNETNRQVARDFMAKIRTLLGDQLVDMKLFISKARGAEPSQVSP